MCLAIKKPADTTISREHLEAGFRRNADGAGFAVATGDRVEIFKGFFNFQSFYDCYRQQTRGEQRPAAIHFRMATHGEINAENCHPFPVGNLAMIHNGIIFPFSRNIKVSDSKNLAEILDRMIAGNEDSIFDWRFHKLVEGVVTSDKVVFLTPKGEFVVVNEDRGCEVDGSWFSNRSFQALSYFS